MIVNDITGAFHLDLLGCGLTPLSDFCGFFPSQPNSTIADTEGEEVTWCTKKGHGARGIPPGTIQGIQVLRNPNYIQIVAFINQVNINIQAADFGGELDGWGQDEVRILGASCVRMLRLTDLPLAGQPYRWRGLYKRFQLRQQDPSANLLLECVRLLQRSFLIIGEF